MIRILIVDDHTLVREALVRLLGEEEDIEIVAETGSGREAVQLYSRHKPDVVILDYGLPDLDGLGTTENIVAVDKRARILVLTMHANEEYALRVLRAGAMGYVVKGASTDELLEGIRKIARGASFVTPAIQDKLIQRIGAANEERPEEMLSNRELQVLLRLARGFSSREVADTMGLSLSTVETYRSRILEKLNLRNNSDVTRFAIRRGLVEAD